MDDNDWLVIMTHVMTSDGIALVAVNLTFQPKRLSACDWME